MASKPKYQYADWKELHGAQKEALEDFAARVKDTVAGALKGVASDHINNVGNASYGEAARQRQQMNGEIKGWQDTISAYQDALNDASSTKSERETANAVINDLQRRIDAYQGAYDRGGVDERAAQSVWNAADRLDDSAKQSVERAKQGLGTLGKGAVDLGVTGIELVSDRLVSPTALYSKLFRLTGRDSQTARKSGADYKSAISYGGASGFSGAAIETLFDGLGGAYGRGITSKKIAKYLDQLGAKEETKNRVMWALNNGGEGFESALTDLSNQLLKSTYNKRSVNQNLSETEGRAVISNAIVNTILGILVKEET